MYEKHYSTYTKEQIKMFDYHVKIGSIASKYYIRWHATKNGDAYSYLILSFLANLMDFEDDMTFKDNLCDIFVSDWSFKEKHFKFAEEIFMKELYAVNRFYGIDDRIRLIIDCNNKNQKFSNKFICFLLSKMEHKDESRFEL